MKTQTFGIEIETTGLLRESLARLAGDLHAKHLRSQHWARPGMAESHEGTARAIAAYFGTEAYYDGSCHSNWVAPTPDDKGGCQAD